MCRHIMNVVCGTCEICVRTVVYRPRPSYAFSVRTGAEPRRPARHAARRCRARSGEARERQIRTATLTAGRAATLHESPAAPATRHTWRDSRQGTAEHLECRVAGAAPTTDHRPARARHVGAPSRREDAAHATPRAQGARSRSRAAGVRARRTPGTTPRPTRSRLQTLVGTRQASACCP